MARNIVVDAGPIVAWLSSRDDAHAWVKDQFARLRPPLLTCEPVLVEASYLLERYGNDPLLVPALVGNGVLRIAISVQPEIGHLQALMRKYRDVPMSLADACIVRLTEQLASVQVMTLDADFRVYRRKGRAVIPLLAPEGV